MKPFIIIILIFIFNNIFAQDIVIMKNGDEVEVKIIEVGIETITYKKQNYIDGPNFIIPKKDIFMIKYKNGTKDVFSTNTNQIPKKIEQKKTKKQLRIIGNHCLGIKFNIGIAKKYNHVNVNGMYKYYFMPTSQLGLFYDYNKSKFLNFGSELFFDYVSVKGKAEGSYGSLSTVDNPDGVLYNYTNDVFCNYFRLSFVPVYYGAKFNNLELNIGMQFAIRLLSNCKYVNTTNGSDNTTSTSTSTTNGYSSISNTITYGPKISLNYKIKNNLLIETAFYYGGKNCTSCISKFQYSWKEILQFTFGIKYNIFHTDKSNTEIIR